VLVSLTGVGIFVSRYDAIALGAEEAKYPSAVPVGMAASLVAVTIIYVLMVRDRLRIKCSSCTHSFAWLSAREPDDSHTSCLQGRASSPSVVQTGFG